MILIADSGATKTEWCILSASENQRIKTQGISPYFLNAEQVAAVIRSELLPAVEGELDISDIHFYGTGCTAPHTSRVIADALAEVFPGANVNVSYDLFAAAHALCGNMEGIICILGTGSSSGYFDGKDIQKNIAGLGYVLGDEGSGAYLGKMFATQYLYNKIDAPLRTLFEAEFQMNPDLLLYKVYSEPHPNRFFASFSYFLSRNRQHPQVKALLKKGLGDFFDIHLSEYDQRYKVPVHFTGSISVVYRLIIGQLCTQNNVTRGKVMAEPMDGLIEYYRGRYALKA